MTGKSSYVTVQCQVPGAMKRVLRLMLPILILPGHWAAVVAILVVLICRTGELPSVGFGVLATTIVWTRRV